MEGLRRMSSHRSKDKAGKAGGPKDLDVATAAVWAYEHGYLRVLLSGPPLHERLEQLTDSCQLTSCPQLLLLCPSDGQPPENPEKLAGGRLVAEGRADTFSQSVAGARSRPYGGHPVFKLTHQKSPEASEQRLAAVEAVNSIRTVCVVAEAMKHCPRQLPKLDAKQLVGQFVARLRETVAEDKELRASFRLVEYDPSQESALEAALEAAAFEDAGSAKDAEERQTPAPEVAPLPGGVGVYLAWSFLHGYLALTAGRRDVAGELTQLRSDAYLKLPLPRIVILCPTTTDWSDDLSSLDGELEPVRDVAGVQAGVPALSGRSYGNFTIYRSRQGDGDCFALELATPLRTLRLGVESSGLDQQVYRREAASFTEELQTLLKETPSVAAHYCVLRVDADTAVHSELSLLAAGHFRPQQAESPQRTWRNCTLL